MFRTSLRKQRRGADYVAENYYTDKNTLMSEAQTSMRTLETGGSGTVSASAAAKKLEAESTAIVMAQETGGNGDKNTAL